MYEIDQSIFIYNRLSGQKDMRFFDVAYAKQLGSDKALLLCQVINECKASNPNVIKIQDRYWFKATAESLASDANYPWLARRTVQRYMQELVEHDLLLCKQLENTTDRAKYYAPNISKIYEMLQGTYILAKIPIGQNGQCIGQIDQSNGQNGQSQETVSPIKEVKRLKIKEIKDKDTEPIARARDLMFDTVAEVTQFDPKLNGSRIAKASNALKKAGYIPEDITEFLQWWKLFDFRWRQSKQLPLPEQIITFIGRSQMWSRDTKGDQEDNSNLFPADYVPGQTLKDYTERNSNDTN